MKKAVMYGAGNIGRGFIGLLFSQSGYEVTFIDIDSEVVDRLNAEGRYPVKILEEGGGTVWVENVRAVNGRDVETAAQKIAEADIMATAVGANVLPAVAPIIAAGLEQRWRAENPAPLDILVCENLKDGDKVLFDLLAGCLPPHLGEKLRAGVGTVACSIGRMVPDVTPELKAFDPLCVGVEGYAELPVDAEGFKGGIPRIENLMPVPNFEFYTDRKLYVHNMTHAAAAYLGSLSGCDFIWQAMEDEAVRKTLSRALESIASALSKRHGVAKEEVISHGEELFARFENRLLGDTVARVGRDTRRKLSKSERFEGAVSLCIDQGVAFDEIAMGMAAALLFERDGSSAEVAVRAALEGAAKTLADLSGLDAKGAAVARAAEYYEEFSRG